MATKNVQLKNSDGDLLMPATLSELILDQTTTTQIWSNTKTGTTSSYFTSGQMSTPLAQNTVYRVVVSSGSSRAAAYDMRKMEGSSNRGKIATIPAGADSYEFTFNTGSYNINKFQIVAKVAITWTIKVYLDTKTSLNDRILAIEEDVDAVEEAVSESLYNYDGYGFKTYSSLVTKSSQTGTTYPWSILPHKVDPSLYCKLEFTSVTASGSVTVKALMGNSAVKTIGTIASSDTAKTFYFSANEFDKIQLLAGSATISYTARLYVVADFYRDAQKHLDYNTKSALFKSSLKSIAHQGYSPDQYAAACRLSAIIAASENHYDGVEVDVVFSSDGVPFLCHDATFSSGGTTITIANETAEDLVTYTYYGETICSLDDAVRTCKLYGLDMILDHTAAINTQAKADAVVAIINKYKAWDNIIWTTASSYLTRTAILTLYQKARVLAVQDGAVTQTNINNVNTLAANGVNVIFEFNYENNDVEAVVPLLQQLSPGVEVSVYTLEKSSNPKADSVAVWNDYAPYVNYALSGLVNEFMIRTGYINIHG